MTFPLAVDRWLTFPLAVDRWLTSPLAVDRWLTFPSAVDRWLTFPSAVDRWLTSSTYRFPLGEDLGEAAGRFRGGLFNFQFSTFNFLPFHLFNFSPLIAPRSIGLHSTEHRPTLHVESAYSPRSIGLLSTEHRLTLHGA